MDTVTYLEGIRRGMWEEMEADPTVFLLGQDIGVYGGPFQVTRGFLEKFGPDRVYDTPISEAAMVGWAAGAAMFGLRPIVEFQFMDFFAPAFNQILNLVSKSRWRWGVPVPIVIRGPVGAGTRAGPFHSSSPEAFFCHIPGLKVVAPATPADARGLIRSAIRDPDPVIYLEHKLLYRRIKGKLPSGDGLVPLGRARIDRRGSDLTLVTYGAMLYTARKAVEIAAQSGISVELIDLRSLVPLDLAAILQSVKKTSKLIILHEDLRTGGLAGEIAMRVMESAFEDLDGPIVRVTSKDTPVPQAPTLEDAFLPGVRDVTEAIRRLAAY